MDFKRGRVIIAIAGVLLFVSYLGAHGATGDSIPGWWLMVSFVSGVAGLATSFVGVFALVSGDIDW